MSFFERIDQLYVDSTRSQCPSDYVRFLNTLGYYQSVHSNDLTYNMYRGGMSKSIKLMYFMLGTD